MTGKGTSESRQPDDAVRERVFAPQSPARFYLPELDVLRFFAFFAVFALHVSYDTVTDCRARTGVDLLAHHHLIGRVYLAGGSGVDLFFTLSAFLITELLLKERAATGQVDVESFYIRRILRIWPLYFFFLGGVFVASRLAPGIEFKAVDFIPLLLLVGNFAACSDALPIGIAHLWSISVEEQFYLLWPLVVRRTSRPAMVRAALVLLGISGTARLALAARGIGGAPVAFNTFTRLDSMAVGILLASAPRERLANLPLPPRVGLVLFGLACWLLAAYFLFPSASGPATVACYSAIAAGSAAIVMAALGSGKIAGRLMLDRRLIYLGKISYGLYIYHRFAISLALMACAMADRGKFDFRGLLLRAALSFALCVALAAVSYRWLETPFLALKRRFTHVPSRAI